MIIFAYTCKYKYMFSICMSRNKPKRPAALKNVANATAGAGLRSQAFEERPAKAGLEERFARGGEGQLRFSVVLYPGVAQWNNRGHSYHLTLLKASDRLCRKP